MTESDTEDDLVAVYVPRRHLQSVYELLGRLMAGEGDEPGPPDAVMRVHVDDDQGDWSDNEMMELTDKVSGTLLGRIIGQIADASPNWIHFSDLVYQVDADRDTVRAQLGTLTKYCRPITGRKSWPFSANYRGDEMAYKMPFTLAEWWRENNLILAEIADEEWRAADQIRVFEAKSVVPHGDTGSSGRDRLGPSETKEANVATRNQRHVTPSPSGKWQVKKPGAKRSSAVHDTQADAINAARQIVKSAGGGEVVIHGRDGRIRDSDTIAPGNDPNPPRDTR